MQAPYDVEEAQLQQAIANSLAEQAPPPAPAAAAALASPTNGAGTSSGPIDLDDDGAATASLKRARDGEASTPAATRDGAGASEPVA